MKKPHSKVAQNRPPTVFVRTGPVAQKALNQKSHTTKSPLMQDWVFRMHVTVLSLVCDFALLSHFVCKNFHTFTGFSIWDWDMVLAVKNLGSSPWIWPKKQHFQIFTIGMHKENCSDSKATLFQVYSKWSLYKNSQCQHCDANKVTYTYLILR